MFQSGQKGGWQKLLLFYRLWLLVSRGKFWSVYSFNQNALSVLELYTPWTNFHTFTLRSTLYLQSHSNDHIMLCCLTGWAKRYVGETWICVCVFFFTCSRTFLPLIPNLVGPININRGGAVERSTLLAFLPTNQRQRGGGGWGRWRGAR